MLCACWESTAATQLLRVAGALIVLLGLITFARGMLPMSAHLHGL